MTSTHSIPNGNRDRKSDYGGEDQGQEERKFMLLLYCIRIMNVNEVMVILDT